MLSNSVILSTHDILFQFHHLHKSCENRPVWGACKFQALWSLLKGFYFFKYFPEKEGILMVRVELTNSCY